MTLAARLRLALARLLWPQGFAPQGRHLHRDPPKGRRKALPPVASSSGGVVSRFVTCIPPCENTVEQHPDAAGVWRPDPPICAACRERLAEQAREWYAHCGRAREA